MTPEQSDLLHQMWPYRRLSRPAFHGQQFRIEDTSLFYDEALVLGMVEIGLFRVVQEGVGRGKPCPFTVLLSDAGAEAREQMMNIDAQSKFDEED